MKLQDKILLPIFTTFLALTAYTGFAIVEAVNNIKPTVVIETPVTPSIDFIKSVIECAHNEYLSDESCEVMHYEER